MQFIKITKICLLILFLPSLALAQASDVPQDRIFKAEVIEVIEQRINILPDGTETEQQSLKLRGLKGDFKDKEFQFIGMGGYDVIKKNIYKTGDKVLAVESFDFEGNSYYYIIDYVRTSSLWILIISFILTIVAVGGWKGFRSLISLVFTFLIIIKYIIPSILSGANPLIVTLIGSSVILLLIIYITEKFTARSHIAVLSIFFSLLITIFLSWFFVGMANLTGASNEEFSFLVNIGGQVINFKGLLLAGIIIGALGVLDDVVISQIASVEQIIKANNMQSKSEVFKRAYKIGVSHISSMTNTLFLAYAGVSMPLLILFISGESAFFSWAQIINNEAVAAEIVRALAGSIGLILSVPISTMLAVSYFCKKR